MDIVLDERKWITGVLESNNLGKRPVYAVATYARYLHSIGVERREMRKRIEELLIRCDPGINLVRWNDRIESAIKHARDRGLIQIDAIDITEAEIETIKKANGLQRQKLLFTLLCVAKYNMVAFGKTVGWVNADIAELFKTANVVVGVDKRGLMLGDLISDGFISKHRRPDSVSVRVNFINSNSNTAMRISDFRSLGFQYDNYLHGGYIWCIECGLIVRRAGWRQKYCRECGKAINAVNASKPHKGSAA